MSEESEENERLQHFRLGHAHNPGASTSDFRWDLVCWVSWRHLDADFCCLLLVCGCWDEMVRLVVVATELRRWQQIGRGHVCAIRDSRAGWR